MKIKSTEKPLWNDVRGHIARALVRLAQKIKPDSPDVYAFHLQVAMDQAIIGRSIVRIDPFTVTEIKEQNQ